LAEERAKREERLQFAVEKMRADTERRVREIAEKRREQAEALAGQLQQARENGQREVDALRRDFRDAKRAKDQELEMLKLRIRQEDEGRKVALVELREKCEMELSELDAQQKAEIAGIGEAAEAVKREREQFRAEHARKIEREQKDYEERMAEIRKRFEEENAAGEREIEEVQAEKEKVIAELDAETRMWEEKYRNRDARPEDLERIAKLQELIRVRAEAVAAVREELRGYEPQMGMMRCVTCKTLKNFLIQANATPPTSKLPPLSRPT
jgi:serologically defined colon cancer antigen 8